MVKELKAGAQLYTVRDYTQTAKGVAESMRKVAEMGYRAVQVSAFGPIAPQEVARIAGDHGLEIVATHFGWDEFRDNLAHLIEVHQMWGCRHAAIGGLPKEYFRAGGAAQFAGELGPIANRLARAKVADPLRRIGAAGGQPIHVQFRVEMLRRRRLVHLVQPGGCPIADQFVAVVVVGEVDAGRAQALGDRAQLRGEALDPAGLAVLLRQPADGGVPAPPTPVDVDHAIEIGQELVPPEVRRRDLQAMVPGQARDVRRIDLAECGHLHARVSGGAHLGEGLRHAVGGVGMAAHRIELGADSEVVHVDSPELD